MKRRSISTREHILKAAGDVAREVGPEKLSFDRVASRLGLTKQAVIYWFPTKYALLSAITLPALRDEAAVAIAAVQGSSSAADALARFVRALARFHLADLERFRLMYVVPQAGLRRSPDSATPDLLEDIHPISASLYAALEESLRGDCGDAARRMAFAAHTAVLGLVLMFSLANAVSDPLRHSADEAVEALVALLSGEAARGG